MKKLMVAALAMGVTGFFGFSGTVYADNITMWDGQGGLVEDEEVEPGMQPGQRWDLEGFFLEGNNLSVVGGYDFINGTPSTSSSPATVWGDIFVDIDGDYGRKDGDPETITGGNYPVNSTFGYDYVFDLDLIPTEDTTDPANWYSYTLRKFTTGAQTNDVWYAQNGNVTPGSNPFRYVEGSGDVVVGSGIYVYTPGLTAAETGFVGDWHNKASGFNIAPILASMTTGKVATFHNTMSCGNDNLMGRTSTPVPEPGMLLLVGTAFAGLVNVRRKRIKRA